MNHCSFPSVSRPSADSGLRTLSLALAFLLPAAILPAADTLPRDHPYQEVLRDHLASLTVEDLDVPLLPFVWESEWMPEDGEELHRLWLLTQTSPIGHPAIVRTATTHYLLDSIESPEGVRMVFNFADPKQAAWLVTWDHPSNPYQGHEGLTQRALVVAAVDMMMLDQYHDRGQGRRSDFVGGSLVWMSYVYHHLGDRWPEAVREAYEDGLHRMVDKLHEWGPTSVNDNMDTKSVVAMHYIQASARDPELAGKAEAYAQRVMSRVHASGMILDAGGLDASYHGIAVFFMAWAAAATEWDFLDEAFERMNELKAYLILPDWRSGYISPSHFSTRTSFGIEMDQWSFYQRDVAVAMLSPHSRFLAFGGRPGRSATYAVNEPERMKARIANHFSRPAPEPLDTAPELWREHHWPGRNINYAADYYRPGFYAELRHLQAAESPETRAPFAREGETFLRNFADTFLVHRGAHFGTLLYTGPIGWHRYMNYAGGSLSAFWVPPNQTFLLGHAAGDHTRAPWPEWRSWPTHALSGSTVEGKAFSSARIRQRVMSVEFDLDREIPEVRVSGPMGAAHDGGRAVQDEALRGDVSYSRLFRIEDERLVIETRWSSDGSDAIAELVEIFPVFLGDPRFVEAPPEVHFEVDSDWVPATAEPIGGVTAIRVRTPEAAVRIGLDHPRTVQLAEEVFQDDYMTRNRLHNILISLVEPNELNAGISEAAITTTIQPLR